MLSSDGQWSHHHRSADHDGKAIRGGSRRNAARPIWRAYLVGQIFGVGKAALWWSTVGLLMISLLNNGLGLAANRGAFNLALLIASPLAVQGAEQIAIKKLLINTTALRLFIWALCIPILVRFVPPTWILWLSLGFAMFVDGIGAAYANSVDIDCGGLDILSTKYDLPLTDFLRYRYTSVQQTAFDCAFLFFVAPLMGLVAYVAHQPWSDQFLPEDLLSQKSSLFFAGSVIGMFAILSLCSIHFYARGLPQSEGSRPSSPLSCALYDNANSPLQRERGNNVSWIDTYTYKICEMADGFVLVLANRGLKWRLVFLAAETALEDAMVSVIIPMGALYLTPVFFNTEDILIVALVSATAVGVGKIGGCLASNFLLTAATTQGLNYTNKLFRSVLLSALFLLLVPLGVAFTLFEENSQYSLPGKFMDNSPLVGACLSALGVFLFFVFSTAPKVGFSSMIQESLSLEGNEAQAVFGFIGLFVTITDGLLIIGLNFLFIYVGREAFDLSLAAVIGAYLVFASLEYKYGSGLTCLTVNYSSGRSP